MAPKALIYVEGLNGQIELRADRLIITRKGFLNVFKFGFNSKREIPLSSLSSIDFRDASFFKLGEIDFDFAGHGGAWEGKTSAVTFNKKKQQDFDRLKEKIFELLSKRNT